MKKHEIKELEDCIGETVRHCIGDTKYSGILIYDDKVEDGAFLIEGEAACRFSPEHYPAKGSFVLMKEEYASDYVVADGEIMLRERAEEHNRYCENSRKPMRV